MDAGAKLYLAQLVRKHRGTPVTFLDDVGDPKDDGRYVSLPCYLDGRLATVIVFTTANFYEALHRVVNATLPGLAERPIH